MSAFLFLLVKLNLAMGMAIILVALLRRPLRAWFGAPIAYAIWFLVPTAGLAVLLPPRVVLVAPVPAPAAPYLVTHIAPLRVTEEGVARAIAALPSAPVHQIPDIAPLLFVAWVLGTLFMVSYLTRSQLRFSAAMRRGVAGPAVLGFFRPRIVTPDGFQEHFSPQEQAAILAHERVHLARQDARINALAALLRCLCWFNPLVHLGACWLRIDQELACDATAVAEAISRRHYAEALLKTQLVVTALPLGCNWPGSEHPLVDRIALLKRKPPGAARRLAGVSFVMVAASFAGLGAWAAQPPVAAKSPAATKPGIALAALEPGTVSVAAPDQTIRESVREPVLDPNPGDTGKDRDASMIARAYKAVLPSPASVQAPSIGIVEARMEPGLAALPQIASISESPGPSSAAPAGAVVAANTPSGAGDPEAIVCRAPQHIAGSDQTGPQVCLHNHEWWKVAMNGKDVAPDGQSLIDRPTVANPTGEGDPEAVTCRTPKFVMLGPLVPVCRLNRFWADVTRNHELVDADGVVVTQVSNRGPFGGFNVGYNNGGNGGWPGHDSGQAWQSSGKPP